MVVFSATILIVAESGGIGFNASLQEQHGFIFPLLNSQSQPSLTCLRVHAGGHGVFIAMIKERILLRSKVPLVSCKGIPERFL